MILFPVPIIYYALPFILLSFALMGVNWLIKRGVSFRPLALVLCLIIGCIWILVGYLLFGYILILPIIIIVTGVAFVLIGCFRIMFVSKRKIIKMEEEERLAEQEYKDEMKNYESYEWVRDQSIKMLDLGTIDDRMKYSRLIEVLDNNRKYKEFKQLSKRLKELDSKIQQEAMRNVRFGGL